MITDNQVSINQVGLTIETCRAFLKRQAMEKHQIWLNNPTDTNRWVYARALKDWAIETKNKRALEHAKSLMT